MTSQINWLGIKIILKTFTAIFFSIKCSLKETSLVVLIDRRPLLEYTMRTRLRKSKTSYNLIVTLDLGVLQKGEINL
jgi:hypothetical protein